jgi:hypothetical protein
MVDLQLICGALSGALQRCHLLPSPLHQLVVIGVLFQVCIGLCDLYSFIFTEIQVNFDIS